jgi:predicted Zn-ribbon and HTH transcriptional regulator
MPRPETIRAALRQALEAGPLTAHELSARVRIPEKQVAAHLEHLARSLKARGERLRVDPARCPACGFTFRKRERLTAPSRCPVCRSEQIEPPRFAVA